MKTKTCFLGLDLISGAKCYAWCYISYHLIESMSLFAFWLKTRE